MPKSEPALALALGFKEPAEPAVPALPAVLPLTFVLLPEVSAGDSGAEGGTAVEGAIDKAVRLVLSSVAGGLDGRVTGGAAGGVGGVDGRAVARLWKVYVTSVRCCLALSRCSASISAAALVMCGIWSTNRDVRVDYPQRLVRLQHIALPVSMTGPRHPPMLL